MNGSVGELLSKAELVFDGEGRRKAVVLDYSIWQDLLDWIEEMEDSALIEESRKSGEETVSWEEAKKELRAKGVDV